MVEILIAIAIFSILMIPIVSGIISSMNNTTQAKTLQYRNEYAENMMEYVKQDSIENILSGSYLSSIGSYSPVVSANFYTEDGTDKTYGDKQKKFAADLTANGIATTVNETKVKSGSGKNEVKYPYEEYTISGKVKLGTKHTVYSYKMEISNKYYAEKEAKGSFTNPNNLALGVVEDIDHTKVALINGTIANYDASVSQAFLTKKLQILKEKEPDWYEIYMQQATDANMFVGDTVARLITIKVSGSLKKGYDVICKLTYHDNGESRPSIRDGLMNYKIEYVPFQYHYNPGTELPNIYVMYNACLYNGQFSKDDYIAFDTSEMEDDTDINCFIVETAEKYSETLAEANEGLVDNTSTLYNDNRNTDRTRDEVSIHMVATSGSNLRNLRIYNNFDLDGSSVGINKKNKDILYKDSDTRLLDGLSSLSSETYVPLVKNNALGGIDTDKSVFEIGGLNAANQETRGLYEVKLWIEEGDSDNVDTSGNPVMTATKGGDES